jgi:DNA-binding beta-propeller fold protein YncE
MLPRVDWAAASRCNALAPRTTTGDIQMHRTTKSAHAALFAVTAFAAAAAYASAAPIAYVTSETNGVGIIDLGNMSLEKTISLGKDGPRGLSLTADGKRLLVAAKTGELIAIDTSTGKVVDRVKIGKNPEFVRVHRGYAYVTYEPGESGPPPEARQGGAKPGQPAAKPEQQGEKDAAKGHADDDDANSPPAEIAIVDLKTMKVLRSVKSGHETEGVEFSPDGHEMLVTNEGDDTVPV